MTQSGTSAWKKQKTCRWVANLEGFLSPSFVTAFLLYSTDLLSACEFRVRGGVAVPERPGTREGLECEVTGAQAKWGKTTV